MPQVWERWKRTSAHAILTLHQSLECFGRGEGSVSLPAGRVERTLRESMRVYTQEFVDAGVLVQEEWLTCEGLSVRCSTESKTAV